MINFGFFLETFIPGLDPARPLIEKHASHGYRLTRDDASVVQIIHTNAGTLGQQSLTGSLDLCINGGSLQPFCRRGLRLSMNILLMISIRTTKFFSLYFNFLWNQIMTRQVKTAC